MTYGI